MYCTYCTHYVSIYSSHCGVNILHHICPSFLFWGVARGVCGSGCRLADSWRPPQDFIREAWELQLDTVCSGGLLWWSALVVCSGGLLCLAEQPGPSGIIRTALFTSRMLFPFFIKTLVCRIFDPPPPLCLGQCAFKREEREEGESTSKE